MHEGPPELPPTPEEEINIFEIVEPESALEALVAERELTEAELEHLAMVMEQEEYVVEDFFTCIEESGVEPNANERWLMNRLERPTPETE